MKLKDEVDILRETADKATKYEATIESYKKKLEDMSDLKRQVKLLEEKNTDYMQKNMELEEDVKKTGSWKPQVRSDQEIVFDIFTTSRKTGGYVQKANNRVKSKS